MESPTYPGALSLARLSQVALLPLAMDPGGPDPLPLYGRASSSAT